MGSVIERIYKCGFKHIDTHNTSQIRYFWPYRDGFEITYYIPYLSSGTWDARARVCVCESWKETALLMSITLCIVGDKWFNQIITLFD